MKEYLAVFSTRDASRCRYTFQASLRCALILVLFVIAVSVCGCAEGPRRIFGRGAAPKAGRMSKEKLRDELDNFEEFYRNNTSQALIEIEQRQPTVRTSKRTLLLKTRANQAFHAMMEHEDSIIAFIETWGLCVRTTQYFEEGHGSRFFGEHQHFIVEAVKRNEAEIERIGRLLLDDKMFAETHRNAHAFAARNPIKDTYSNGVVYSTQVRAGEPNPYLSVITLPLAPLEALRGVDRTPLAIEKFSNTAARFSDVVEGFPEASKWQMQLLLYDLEETEMVKSLLESMSDFSDSSARFADTAEELPEKLSTLISELDEKQANLQVTLEKAEKTSSAIEQTLVQADKAAISFQVVTNNINQVATAWEKAALATTEVLAGFEIITTPSKDKDADTKPDFSLIDFRETVEVVGQTVSEMGDLTDKVYELIASEQLDKYASMPGKLANLLAWRFGQLIILIFILAIMYRVIIVRFVNKQK